MKKHVWSEIPREQMNPQFARRVIHGSLMTVARVELAKDSVVPRHSHENEQICVLLEGRLRFVFDTGEVEIGAQEVMEIAPDLPHAVVAIEDSVAFDLFSPVREDWLRGEDAYLRQASSDT